MAQNCTHPREEFPACPRCKVRALHHVQGIPPGKSFATCASCGHSWKVCGSHPDAVRGPCFGRPRAGHDRCYAHGGNPQTGRPIAHGGRSKLWQRLGIARTAEEAATDPELLTHRQNVLMIEAMMLAEADTPGASSADWEAAAEAYRRGVEERDVSALRALGALLADGVTASKRWERVLELAEAQRKHKESESRREAALDQGMTRTQAMAFAQSIFLIVDEEVTDPATKRRIGQRIARLVRPASGEPALPGGEPA